MVSVLVKCVLVIGSSVPYTRIFAHTRMGLSWGLSHMRILSPYTYGIALFSLQFTLQYNHACRLRVEIASASPRASLTLMTHWPELDYGICIAIVCFDVLVVIRLLKHDRCVREVIKPFSYSVVTLVIFINWDVHYQAMHACMHRFDPHKWHCMGFYMLILDSLHVYTDSCTTPPIVTTAIAS